MDAAAAPTADLSLPELQQRFAEVIGESTRCPNKKYLIRRITKALEDEADDAPEEAEANAPAEEESAGDDGGPEEKLSKLDVDALRDRYLEVVGRPTRSQNKGYLVWKIRQAQRGQIPVGPIARTSSGPQKVIPLRLDAELADRLDAVRRQRGLRSRMELFRRALRSYLTEIGEEALADQVLIEEAPVEPATA